MATQKRIFIVDDDIMYSEMLKHKLSSIRNLDIQVFDTGEDMLGALEDKDDTPHLILLDYYLDSVEPGAMNGVEVLKSLKSNYSDIPVILLTRTAESDITVEALEEGAQACVIKNIKEIERLKKLVPDLLEEEVS